MSSEMIEHAEVERYLFKSPSAREVHMSLNDTPVVFSSNPDPEYTGYI